MTSRLTPPRGVIEGFFGRPWRWDQRQRLAEFLASEGLDFYLYAPKSDAALRRRWRGHWQPEDFRQLQQLRAHCRRLSIDFGVGLSPLDLCTPEGEADTGALRTKIETLNTLSLDRLALLFDDMRGDLPQLATRQCQLAHRAAEWSNARQIVLCPTYYSLDPVLDKVFAPRPEHYLEDLGRELDGAIDVLWTGPKVCSEHYPLEHLQAIGEALGRKPFLWDNYPVNDGAVKSKHLYLGAPRQDRGELLEHIGGLAINPMNQFALSLPPIAAVARTTGPKRRSRASLSKQVLIDLCPQDVARALLDDAPLFEQTGLEGLSRQQREALARKYRNLSQVGEFATEVADWLDGHYAFDPACLTE